MKGRVPTPFEAAGVVKPEWIDENNHMNVIYYMECFYRSSNTFFEFIGITYDYDRVGETSLMTLGSNIDYRSEVVEGDALRTTNQLLDWDHNKIHLYFETWQAEENRLAANAEILFLHVNLKSRKSKIFQSFTKERLAKVQLAHAQLGKPENINRRLGIRRKEV